MSRNITVKSLEDEVFELNWASKSNRDRGKISIQKCETRVTNVDKKHLINQKKHSIVKITKKTNQWKEAIL